MESPTVIYTQDSGGSNPTHRSLHEALARQSNSTRPFRYFFFSRRGEFVYIHFPDGCFGTASFLKMALKFGAFMAGLIVAKATKAHIVWEVNNVRSHENRFPRFERVLMFLFTRSLAGIVHYSKTSIREVEKAYPHVMSLPQTVIPHPNFHHLYSRAGDPERGRLMLGVRPSDLTVLVFGMIRRYKGIDKLIALFKQIERESLRLVVAGKPVDKPYAEELQKAAQTDSRIRILFRDIPEQDIPDIYAAASMYCAPFRSILNSGSAILSLSLNCPVLVPRMGSLQDLADQVGSDWIRLYDGDLDLSTIRDALDWSSAPRSKTPPLEFCDIDKVASETIAFLDKIAKSP